MDLGQAICYGWNKFSPKEPRIKGLVRSLVKMKEAENFNGEPNGRFYVIAVQGDCVTPSLPACFLSTGKQAASSYVRSSHDVPTIIGTKRQGQMTMDWILQSCELAPTFPFLKLMISGMLL